MSPPRRERTGRESPGQARSLSRGGDSQDDRASIQLSDSEKSQRGMSGGGGAREMSDGGLADTEDTQYREQFLPDRLNETYSHGNRQRGQSDHSRNE